MVTVIFSSKTAAWIEQNAFVIHKCPEDVQHLAPIGQKILMSYILTPIPNHVV